MTDTAERPRPTVAEAIERWETKGPTSLTVAIMSEALYGAREDRAALLHEQDVHARQVAEELTAALDLASDARDAKVKAERVAVEAMRQRDEEHALRVNAVTALTDAIAERDAGHDEVERLRAIVDLIPSTPCHEHDAGEPGDEHHYFDGAHRILTLCKPNPTRFVTED